MDLDRNTSISQKPLNVTNSNSSNFLNPTNIGVNFTLSNSFKVTDKNKNVGRFIPIKSDMNHNVNINKIVTVLTPFKPSNINIDATVTLYVIPVIEMCGHLHHGWEVSLEIDPYVQFSLINWSWKCMKVMYMYVES